MRKTRLLKHFLLLCAIIAGSTSVWAGDVTETITLSAQGYSNAQTVSSTQGDVVTLTYDKGESSTTPAYYNTGNGVRVYYGGKMIITADNYTISKVVVTYAKNNSPTISWSSDGTATSTTTDSPATWIGSATSIDFNVTQSGHARIQKVEVTYSTGGDTPSLDPNDLALTGDPVALTFDLYNNAAAKVVSYTTSSTGAITITPATSAYFTYVHDAEAKTITVTPTAVTSSAQTIEVSQAADNTYAEGSKTFTVSITDSTPFDGVIFDATKDKDVNNTSQGQGSITKDNVTFSCTSGILGNGSEYRLYKNSTTTISTSDGSKIKKIEFIGVSSYAASNFSNQTGWTTVGDNGTWEGEAESVSFVASGAQVRATLIKVTVEQNTDPSITANDVEIAYDATNGAIIYTINKATNDGVLSASTTSDWLAVGTVGETVPFTCSANAVATARTATVTLTYTYDNDKTVTKDVTVTQAGNPDAVDNISDINAVGTAYTVKGTVVATNSKGFIIGDGTGYVYYYKNAAVTQSIGDKVKISGTTGTYGHIIQFTSTATVSEATSSSYTAGTPAAAVITEVPDYSEGYHLSTYLEFEGALSKDGNNYLITLGGSQIQISYPTTDQGTALTDLIGKTAHVKGYFSGINSSSKFTIMLESVEEVVSTEPQIVVSSTTVNLAYDATSGEIPFEIVNPVPGNAIGAGTFDTPWITNVDVANVSGNDYKVTFSAEANTGAERTGVIRIVYGTLSKDVTVIQAAYVEPTTYSLVTSVTPGKHYIIVGENNGTYKAMGQQTTNNRAAVAISVNEGTTTITSNEVCEVLIKYDDTTGNYVIFDEAYNSNAGGYLYAAQGSGTGNYMKTEDSLDSDGNGSWTISIASTGVATIIATNPSITRNTIRYNSGSSLFSCYASGQRDIYLYERNNDDSPVQTTITVSPAHEYISFARACNLDFTQVEGLETYIVTKVNETSVSIQKIEAAVPAGTGLILKKTGTASSFDVPVVAEATAPAGNKLTGVTEPTLIGNTNATDYILFDGKFYPASQGTLPAGKAYLRVEEGNAPELGLDFSGETTGIVNVNRETITNNQYYTLDGRRVENPTNGIYIINGRKVVVK